jgi:opacity protein-like surface antigen
MRKQFALATVLAFGLAGSALAADGFSYDNVELSYASINPKGGSDVDGFGLAGSYSFSDNFSMFAGYDDVKDKRMNLGVGYHRALSSSLDLTSGLSYETVDSGPNASGYGLGLGLRGRLSESFEWTGGLKYSDLNKGSKAQTTFTVGGRYYFTPAFAVGADYSDEDDLGSSYRVALRYDFGTR